MDISVIRNNVILDFKNGLSTKELMLKYGYSKSTINDWVRETRNKVAEIEFKQLKEKYIKLHNNFERTKLDLEIYKELSYLISTSQRDRLNAIEKLYNIYPVKPMCRILNISIGTFYNHLNRRVIEPQPIKIDNKLRPLVLEVFDTSKQRFGSTKIAQVLRKNGHKISNEKAKKLMNELNIKPIFGKKEITIPQNVESKNKYLKNLVGGNFKRETPNEVWVGDVTEIIVKSNKFYICVIIDLFSRKVIAYRTYYKNNINLISSTLKDAFESRGEPIGVIFHSDRGSNYTSYKYRMLLKSLKIRSSYSKTARPRQNAVVESFFSFFKKEELYRNSYDSLEHLNDSTHEYILFYNGFRPHYHLNGKTPNEFEKEYLIRNESRALLSEQSNLELKIKKDFHFRSN